MDEGTKLLFIACTEPGALERQSVLLFESIRRWAGRFREAQILSFQPRKGIALDSATKAAFRQLDVEHRADVLNIEFEREPHVNKVFAGAWSETNRTEDVIVFVDSDSFFTAEPTSLELGGPPVAAIRPAGSSGARKMGAVSDRFVGNSPILGYTESKPVGHTPNASYWDTLHELCRAPVGPTVLTDVDQVPVRGVWNAGLVAVRREAGIFRRWLDDYQTLVTARHFPAHVAPYYLPVDAECRAAGALGPRKGLLQPALAPALGRFPGRLKVLDKRYNYPLQLRNQLKEPFRSAQLEELVHVHYYNVFRDPEFMDNVQPPFANDSDILLWLKTHRLGLLESTEAQQLAHHKRKLAAARRRIRHQRQKRHDERAKRLRAERSRNEAVARLAIVQGSLWWRLGEQLRQVAKAAGLSRGEKDDEASPSG